MKKPRKRPGAAIGLQQPAQIVVLGMHRSGTSALTGAFAAMGAFVGDEASLTAKNWENPLGFFERRDLRAICDGILHDCGADWWKVARFEADRIPLSVTSARGVEIRQAVAALDEGAGEDGVWVVKEPRLCLLFPVFRRHLIDPHVVVSIRHPMEVAQSLRHRNGFPIAVGLALWEAYNVAILTGLGGIEPVIVRFSDLVESTDETLKRIASELTQSGVTGLDAKAGAKAVLSSLRRESSEGHGVPGVITQAQSDLWEMLSSGGPLDRNVSMSKEATDILLDFEVDEASRQATLSELKAARSRISAEKGLSEKLKEAEQATARSEKQVTALTQEVALRDCKIADLKVAIKKLNENVAALTTEAASSGAAADVLRAEFEKFRKEMDLRSREIGELQKVNSDLKEKFDSTRKKLADTEAARTRLETIVQTLTEQAEKNSARLELLKKAEADAADLRERIAKLDQTIARRDEEIALIKSARAEAEAACKTAAVKLQAAETEGRHYRERAGQAEKEVSTLKGQLAGLEAQSVEKADALNRVRKSLSASEAASATLQKKLSSTEKQLTQKAAQLAKTEAEILAARSELDGLREELAAKNLALARVPAVAKPAPRPATPFAPVRSAVSWWKERHFRRQVALVRASGYFDEIGYLVANPDVKTDNQDPVAHYLRSGWREGRQPGPHFDPAAYFDANADLDPAIVNPLLHYILHGRSEGRPLRPFEPAVIVTPSTVAAETSAEVTKPVTGDLKSGRPVHPRQGAAPPRIARSLFGRKLNAIAGERPDPNLVKSMQASELKITRIAAQDDGPQTQPLVSIVMPTWNRASIIRDAIQSVIEQEYLNWELLVCDDGSDDDTESVVAAINDARVVYKRLPKAGGAAARNVGLASARGEIIAYLDSDNYWHPSFLRVMVHALFECAGHSSAYSDFVDFHEDQSGRVKVRSFARPAFNHERLLQKNFIDLNSFVHRRELYDCFGGFNEALTRRQDYDLIIKYTWLRDPLHVRLPLALYQRNDSLIQVTTAMRQDDSCVEIIDGAVSSYLSDGLPVINRPGVKKVTILSWDLSRNHFSKPFALAEALSSEYEVQLVSFRFFEEMFPPLMHVQPGFETVYMDGSDFPDFFAAMRKAFDAINGDIIYVVKPRLPSLGLALLVNAARGTPIVLEINDLETVVASPTSDDHHREVPFSQVDLSDPALLNPYSDLWSQLMDPIAKELPVLLTHNKGIDGHFGNRCLYMRNLKDDSVYDPALYDRDEVRAGLGFSASDRIILFGGLLRKHKGIYELVELVDRLDDPRYKLLFVGSRVTPDQDRLMKQYGERIRVLPPQDREAMARINLAADLVILWLDPDVPASHYQMPYKATDAFAMGPAVIANDISDLGELGRQGYLRIVPFGDWDGMAKSVRGIFDNPKKTKEMREAARRLYQRQFSYAAARSHFALAAGRVLADRSGPLPVAIRFADRFNAFYREAANTAETFLSLPSSPEEADGKIVALTLEDLPQLYWRDDEGIAVIMPCINTERGRKTAELLSERAGTPARIFVVEDTRRQGFIRTLNETAARLDVKYVVYLAEDAYPGLDWLRIAQERLDETGKGLLAFNCGKWHGRIAAFGMVRKSWAQKIYGGAILYPGYKAHKADNEITVLARAMDQFVYHPDAVLIEYDPEKPFRLEGTASNFSVSDKRLFSSRFDSGFDRRASGEYLSSIRDEYLNQRKLAKISGRAVHTWSDQNIIRISTKEFSALPRIEGVAIIVPVRDCERAEQTARLLLARAGTMCTCILIVEPGAATTDEIITLALEGVDADFLVYAEDDSFPGVDWLWHALKTIKLSSNDFVFFNHGHVKSEGSRAVVLDTKEMRTRFLKVAHGAKSDLHCEADTTCVSEAALLVPVRI